MIWRAIIGSKAAQAIGAAMLAVLAVLGYGATQRRKGRADQRTEGEIQELNEYVETRKRMDAADTGDDVDEWLRNRAKRGGDL